MRGFGVTLVSCACLALSGCVSDDAGESVPLAEGDGTGGDGASGSGGSSPMASTSGSGSTSGATVGATGADAGPDDGGDGGEGGDDGSDGGSSTGAEPIAIATVAELLAPFDVARQDTVGPASWATQYGKSPEIIAIEDDGAIAIAAHDYGESSSPERIVMLRLEATELGYVVTQVREPPALERLVGFARDDAGAYYLATAIDEDDAITVENPPPSTYRPDVLRVVKLGWSGEPSFDVDVDVARGAFDDEAEQVINPMVAASGRLAVGGGRVALVHGINTPPDSNDVRHQKALTTHLDASDGAVERTSSIWVSHSFDQRLYHDGESFVELHLGDAFPRHVAFARVEPDSGETAAFFIKGAEGANNTFTRLGNAVPLTGSMAAMVLLATEHTTGTDPLFPDVRGFERVAGSRDLAIVRMTSEGTIDSSMPDTLAVQSSGEAQTNTLRWLTDYQSTSEGRMHAERPKLVALDGGHFVVLWEQWELGSDTEDFQGTHAMVIDEAGATVVAPLQVTEDHLPRGDDAFALDGEAVWVTGDSIDRELTIHHVDAERVYRRVVVE